MNYLVFEAGSRAGFSAEMFFRIWKRNHPEKDVELYLADMDPMYALIPEEPGIHRINETEGLKFTEDRLHFSFFPGDELTRQKLSGQREIPFASDCNALVEPWFYSKCEVNEWLQSVVPDTGTIRIPKTFELNNVFIKPNSLSAGSRGLEVKENVCVEEVIDIDKEYVVDVIESDGNLSIYARETKLRGGYDKMIRFLNSDDKVVKAVEQFIKSVNENSSASFFHRIFHLQLAENKNGELYYIEASKRISGTAIVNVFNGYNPFDLLEHTAPKKIESYFNMDQWYRYEDFLLALHNLL